MILMHKLKLNSVRLVTIRSLMTSNSKITQQFDAKSIIYIYIHLFSQQLHRLYIPMQST